MGGVYGRGGSIFKMAAVALVSPVLWFVLVLNLGRRTRGALVTLTDTRTRAHGLFFKK